MRPLAGPAAEARPDVGVMVDVARDLVGVALRSIAPERIPTSQFRLLLLLHEAGDITTGRAAGALGVATASITRVANVLADGGLVERADDPAHRGVVNLRLTAAGTALVGRVLQRRFAELATVIEAVDPRVRDACLVGLSALRTQLANNRTIGGIW